MFKKINHFNLEQWQDQNGNSITLIKDEGAYYYYRNNTNGQRRAYSTLKHAKLGLNIELPNHAGA